MHLIYIFFLGGGGLGGFEIIKDIGVPIIPFKVFNIFDVMQIHTFFCVINGSNKCPTKYCIPIDYNNCPLNTTFQFLNISLHGKWEEVVCDIGKFYTEFEFSAGYDSEGVRTTLCEAVRSDSSAFNLILDYVSMSELLQEVK